MGWLFDDPTAAAKDYFARTGIFPIMHTIAMRREVYEANRWIAQSLTKAFMAAQKITYASLRETAALKAMLSALNRQLRAGAKHR